MKSVIQSDDKILIVAPHADDETIGCGGIMLEYGKQCDILLLTDGRKGYSHADLVDEADLARCRLQELKRVAEITQVNHVFFLNAEDCRLHENLSEMRRFDLRPYDFIFVPNRFERHSDHSVVFPEFKKMKRWQRAKARLIEYEVWSPLRCPSHILDISKNIKDKQNLVQQYKSQIKYVDYAGMVEGLNRYRGAGYKTQYAEAYAVVPNHAILGSLYRKMPDWVKNAYRFRRK